MAAAQRDRPVHGWLKGLSWMRWPLSVWVWSRAAIFGLSALSMRLTPGLFQFAHRRDPFLRHYPTLDGLCRWDCGWVGVACWTRYAIIGR